MPDVVTRAIAEHIELESTIGGYEASALRADAIQQFYTQTGKLIKCDGSNIAFTASATDSFVRALSAIPFQPGDVILTDNDDFISNQIQFLACAKRFGVQLVRIKNAPGGGVDSEDDGLMTITVTISRSIYQSHRNLTQRRSWHWLLWRNACLLLPLDRERQKIDFQGHPDRSRNDPRRSAPIKSAPVP